MKPFNPRHISYVLALALSATSMTACSLKKGLDQMQADTHGMASTTNALGSKTQDVLDTSKTMSNKMDKSNETSGKVLDRIEFSVWASRQGGTSDMRDKFLGEMKSAKSMAEKLKFASSYNQAHEFQIWVPEVSPIEYRETLFKTALEHIVETIEGIRGSTDNSNATGTSQKMKNLYALAATLHKVNPIQDEYQSEDKPFPEYSMLNVITDGLRKLKDVDQNKITLRSLNLSEERAQQYADDFAYILQVRYNFLVGFAWAHLKDGKPDSMMAQMGKLLEHGILPELIDPAKIKMTPMSTKKGIFHKVGNFFKQIANDAKEFVLDTETWEPKWEKLPAARIDRAAEIMEYAVATRKILSEFNIPIHDDRAMRNVMKTLTWSDENKPTAELRVENCNQYEARLRFKNAYDNYLSADPSALPLPSQIKGWSGGGPEILIDHCTKKPIDRKTTFISNVEPFDGI